MAPVAHRSDLAEAPDAEHDPDPDRGNAHQGRADVGSILAEALAERPDGIAFRYQGAEMRRKDLLAGARDVARRLERAGLAPGEPVTVQIGHALALPVAMLGTLLAGGCAVPIDPGLPQDRRDAILSDIDARLSVEEAASGAPELTVRAHPNAQAAGADENCAFIVYTSGSSGTPKGVEITHQSYAGRLRRIAAVAGPDSRDAVDLAWTPPSFIGMLDEIFFSLLTGAPVVIARPQDRTDPRLFADLVQREAITRFRITPSLLDAFLNAGIGPKLAAVKKIFCSGETIGTALQTKVHDTLNAQLFGFYGATEAPGVCYHLYDRADPPLSTTICTVQPFAEARIALPDGSDAPDGSDGEIWIGGVAVASGYWRRPDLTAQKFVRRSGRRWYRTGDRGRRLQDGSIEILGRTDFSETKVHGVRIDLAHVRTALQSLDGVTDAWVSAVEVGAGRDLVLVGHCAVATGTAFDPISARAALVARLPLLAIPRVLIGHDSFPLLANGKLDSQRLDRDAAAHMSKQSQDRQPAAAKRKPGAVSPMNIAVLNCFENALGNRQLTVDEDFFDAGGTSLEAMTLAILLSELFGTEVGMEEVWLHPSARKMAAHLQQTRDERAARSFLHVEGMAGPNLLAIGFGVGHLAGLWPDRRLFVAPGITGDPRLSVHKRLEAYVTEYLEGVRRTQPEGPYQLIGFSFCGLLVYELARRLHAAGERITGIALLEPLTPVGTRTRRSYAAVAGTEFLRSLARRDLDRARLLKRLGLRSVLGPRAANARRLPFAYGHLVAAAERLDPLPVNIDLIHSDGFSSEALDRWRALPNSKVTFHKVTAGRHVDLIQPECVEQWRHVVDQW